MHHAKSLKSYATLTTAGSTRLAKVHKRPKVHLQN